jgi:hypothetical protein
MIYVDVLKCQSKDHVFIFLLIFFAVSAIVLNGNFDVLLCIPLTFYIVTNNHFLINYYYAEAPKLIINLKLAFIKLESHSYRLM